MIRVVSLNLARGIANGIAKANFAGLSPLEVTARELAAIAPDILLLQEVDVRQLTSGFIDQTALLATGVGLKFLAFQSFFCGQTWGLRLPAPDVAVDGKLPMALWAGGFGVAIASRWQLHNIRSKRLGAALPRLYQNKQIRPYFGQNRSVLVADIAVGEDPAQVITVATTHLEIIPSVARKQLQRAWTYSAVDSHPTLLAGDFNLDHADVAAQLSALGCQTQVSGVASFPVRNPKVALDAVVTARINVSTIESLTLPVSDHCAVVAGVEL